MRDTTNEAVTTMSTRRRLVRSVAVAAAVAAPLTISAGCFGMEFPSEPPTLEAAP